MSKPVFSLRQNVQGFIEHYGIENCGFLTLTFPDGVKSVYEASARFNSLRTGFLSKLMSAYIGVYERHKSGVIHFHFVIAFPFNICSEQRKGQTVVFDFGEVKKRNYRSAPRKLRELWAKFRKSLPEYGFGRHELLPVFSGKGVAGYLAKYLAKGIDERQSCDKGFRLVRSTSGEKALKWRRVNSQFAWCDSSREWRKALAFYIGDFKRLILAKIKRGMLRKGERESLLLGMNEGNYSDVMRCYYGSRWCYHAKDRIWDFWQAHKDFGFSMAHSVEWDHEKRGYILGQLEKLGFSIEYRKECVV